MLRRKTEIALILLGAIILCYIGFLNNFPLVYSDTIDYLNGAFTRSLPVDRPVFYGVFMRFVSLQSSLWLVIIAQGILTSYLLFETFNIFYSGNKRNSFFIISIAVLTATTGISENVSLLLPDIFSSIGILCFANLLLNNKLSKLRTLLISFVLVLCMLVHLSNMLAYLSVIILLAIYTAFRHLKKQPITLAKNKLLLCATLILSIYIIAPVGNYFFGHKFTITQSTHIFVMAHMVETGVLEKYLQDECAAKNYKMCAFKDKIDTNFLWSGQGVFPAMGGWGNESKDEFNKIIWDIMTTPKYARMVLQRAVEYSFMQFFMFTIPKNQNWGIPPYITNYYPMYGRDFCASLQSRNKLDQTTTNDIQRILVLISLAVLFYVIFSSAVFGNLPHELRWLAVLIIVYAFINAAICANFSTLNHRYQDRIIWLIPLVAFYIIENRVSYYLNKNKTAGK